MKYVVCNYNELNVLWYYCNSKTGIGQCWMGTRPPMPTRGYAAHVMYFRFYGCLHIMARNKRHEIVVYRAYSV